jgi:hypothetical protein
MSYVRAVLALGVRLADGLAHAHDRGLLHRDIKPANVLLAADGQPMLLDFNLATDAVTPAGAAAAHLGGTLPYMPPEQLARLLPGGWAGAAAPDPRGDVYALGMVLCEILTGRHPFPVRSGEVHDILPPLVADRRTPPDARALNPAVSPATATIIAKCLAPDPARRYQSAHELREDLQRQSDDRPLRFAREPSVRERAQKFRRRHPRLTVVLAAAAVVLPVLVIAAQRQRQLAVARAGLTREEFRRDKQQGWLLLNLHGVAPDERAAGAAAAEAALNRYGVLGHPTPVGPTALGPLPPADAAQVRRDIGELLLA